MPDNVFRDPYFFNLPVLYLIALRCSNFQAMSEFESGGVALSLL